MQAPDLLTNTMHEPDLYHTFENDIFSEVGWGGPADSAT